MYKKCHFLHVLEYDVQKLPFSLSSVHFMLYIMAVFVRESSEGSHVHGTLRHTFCAILL